jgi:hypothetical protein
MVARCRRCREAHRSAIGEAKPVSGTRLARPSARLVRLSLRSRCDRSCLLPRFSFFSSVSWAKKDLRDVNFVIQSLEMNERANAEENLRVIRQLMERVTIYRAVAAPSALVAGLLSLFAAGAVYFNNEVRLVLGRTVRPREFAVLWVVVLILAAIANAYFLWREAERDGRPFVSSGMKLALRAIAPNLLIPAAFTVWFFQTGYLGAQELQLVTVWVAFYGLGLLATGLFAPRSLSALGWAFLLTALATPVLSDWIDRLTDDAPDTIMGLTFGVYHLIYAAATWSSSSRAAAEPFSTE